MIGADGGFSLGQFWFLLYLLIISVAGVGVITLSISVNVPEVVCRRFLSKKAAIKSGDKKVTKKTQMQYDRILEFMEDGKEYGIWDSCELLGLKESRTKDILKGLSDHIEIIGSNRDRRYRKK